MVCDTLAEIIREYSVASTNVFIMNETGSMFGLGASKRVIVPSGDPASRFREQPATQESATVIEYLGSGGQVLPPLIITKGKRHTVGEQRRMNGFPGTWHFSKSDSGWTNSELAVEWLETIFEPSTRPSKPSDWRLLILDRHESHTSQAFCDVLWSHRTIPFLLPPHVTHVMQPLHVSIFGPLTSAYQRLVSHSAESVGAFIDKAQFGSVYAQSRAQVLTQSAARKAFSDSGITLNPSPDKVLRRLAGGSTSSMQVSRMQLQELAVPRSASAFNDTIDAYQQKPNAREARKLRRSVLEANEKFHASIAVLEAEITMLRAQHEAKSKIAELVGRKVAKGDQQVLSKDGMITREHSERELVAKGPFKESKRRGNRQDEAEQDTAPPAATAAVYNTRSDDSNVGILASAMTPPPPPMHTFLDELDDGEPLSSISNDDPGEFGFFDTVPVASSSLCKH